jgi:tRNA(Ile)-lysidine synthase
VELGAGHGAHLEVASIDHGLRPESAGEVAQVGRRTHALGLPFHSLHLDMEPGPGVQLRARELRRASLESIGADRIALAHHRDDQAETVLHHLTRGSGPRGLQGMASRQGGWVRPLLREPRSVLRAWAELRGLRWIEDPSNPTSLRGRMRSDLFPILEEIRPGATAALARSARLLAREDDWMQHQVDQVWSVVCTAEGILRDELATLHPALQLRVLRRWCCEVPFPIRASQLEAAVGWQPQSGARIELAGGWTLRATSRLLLLDAPDES